MGMGRVRLDKGRACVTGCPWLWCCSSDLAPYSMWCLYHVSRAQGMTLVLGAPAPCQETSRNSR